MTYLDKLLALRKDQGEDRREPAGDLLKSEPAIPVKNSPNFRSGIALSAVRLRMKPTSSKVTDTYGTAPVSRAVEATHP